MRETVAFDMNAAQLMHFSARRTAKRPRYGRCSITKLDTKYTENETKLRNRFESSVVHLMRWSGNGQRFLCREATTRS
jgi:hypothetical protein